MQGVADVTSRSKVTSVGGTAAEPFDCASLEVHPFAPLQEDSVSNRKSDLRMYIEHYTT